MSTVSSERGNLCHNRATGQCQRHQGGKFPVRPIRPDREPRRPGPGRLLLSMGCCGAGTRSSGISSRGRSLTLPLLVFFSLPNLSDDPMAVASNPHSFGVNLCGKSNNRSRTVKVFTPPTLAMSGAMLSPLMTRRVIAALWFIAVFVITGDLPAKPFEVGDQEWEGLSELYQIARNELGASNVETVGVLDWGDIEPEDGGLGAAPGETAQRPPTPPRS